MSFILFVYEFSKRHPGIVLVTIGVIGEGLEIGCKLWDKITGKKRPKCFEIFLESWGFIFWVILVFGLVLEMVDSGKIDSKLADAEIQITELQTNETVLSQKQLSRFQIFIKGNDAFVSALKDKPKISVEILYPNGDGGGFEFGLKLADDLAEIGWKVIDERTIQDDDIYPVALVLKQFPTVNAQQRASAENFFNSMPISEKSAGWGYINLVTKDAPKPYDLTGTNEPLGALVYAFKQSGGMTPSYISFTRNSDSRMQEGLLKIEIGPGF
jgi:hypothetical protein